MAEEEEAKIPIQELQVLLRQKDTELNLLKTELDKTRRQCDKANSFNEDLRKQVEELSLKLSHSRISTSRNAATQTESPSHPVVTEDVAVTHDWTEESERSQVSVAECVRAAAEAAQVQTGFIYDESTGYYYDATSGYYYNAENGLYFDVRTGTFFYYDAESGTYKFHSQVEVPKQEPAPDSDLEQQDDSEQKSERSERNRKKRHSEKKSSKRKKSSHSKKKKKKKKSTRSRDSHKDSDDSDADHPRRNRNSSSAEEGECSDSSRDLDNENSEVADNDCDAPHASKWPPCVRAIVQKTDLPKLTVGTLFIVTCQGAVVGRETPADVYVPDILVSKAHAKFAYSEEDKKYRVQDLGSQNGTFLNETRLSEAKQESELHVVQHGDVLQVGCTELLLHIHDGAETCDSCEPGLVQAAAAAAAASTLENGVQIVTKQEKEQERRWQLKQIRRKFGLEDAAYKENDGVVAQEGYEDRAKLRRKIKGVDHPHAKTEMASVDTAIPTCNKGFKLLEKMGWSTGQSLGKTQLGITEPINVLARGTSKAGVGSEVVVPPDSAPSGGGDNKWHKARQRYDQIASSSSLE